MMITVLIIGILSSAAAPRFLDNFSELQLDAAAKHVATDLRYARQLAKTKGTNQSVTFTPAADRYELDGANDIDRTDQSFRVVLPDTEYAAEIASADFAATAVVTFDMHGQPDNGGTVVLAKDGRTKTINVNAATGKVTIQ